MCLAASICVLPGFLACRLTTEVAKAISGRSYMMANMMDPTMA